MLLIEKSSLLTAAFFVVEYIAKVEFVEKVEQVEYVESFDLAQGKHVESVLQSRLLQLPFSIVRRL